MVHQSADVPVSTLARFAAATRRLCAVSLSSSTDASAGRFARAVAALGEPVPKAPIVLGGPAPDGAGTVGRLAGSR